MGSVTVGSSRNGSSQASDPPAPVSGRVVHLSDLQQEVAEFYTRLTKLSETDMAEVFKSLSAISSRTAEIRSWLQSSESRQMRAFKANQVEPLLEECERQYTYLSRLQAVREFELKLVGKD